MNKDPIKCDECGKFIAYKDIDDSSAFCCMYHVYDWFAGDVIEKYKSLCKKCNKKETDK
jgi:hypothetical protein